MRHGFEETLGVGAQVEILDARLGVQFGGRQGFAGFRQVLRGGARAALACPHPARRPPRIGVGGCVAAHGYGGGRHWRLTLDSKAARVCKARLRDQ